MKNKLLADLLPVVWIKEDVNSSLHVGTDEHRLNIAVFGQPHLNIPVISPVSGHELAGSVLLESVTRLGVKNVEKCLIHKRQNLGVTRFWWRNNVLL